MTAIDDKTEPRPSEVFGARLREIRTSRGLTQEALAEIVTAQGRPMNKAAVLRIERGERGLALDEALALAWALQVAPAHLLSPRDDSMVWITNNIGVDGAGMRNWLLFGDITLLFSGRRQTGAHAHGSGVHNREPRASARRCETRR